MQPHSGCLAGALWASLLLAAGTARAEPGVGDDAMPGLVRTDSAEAMTTPLLISAGTAYGFTGAALGQGDRHHRGAGRLVVAYAPLPSLAVALRLDGRYDKHFGDEGRDDGWVGDPRFILRARHGLTESLSLGLQVGAWAPGSEAPSIEVDALSAEASAALTYHPSALSLSANVGYRLDRSAASVADGENLSLADRMSLGVSDYNAALFAVGASYELGGLTALAEWSLDYLHGSGAPGFRESPMRVAAGAQVPLGDALTLFAQSELRLSRVRSAEIAEMLLPFDPRVQVMAGVQMRFGGGTDELPPLMVETPPTIKEPEPKILKFGLKGKVQSGDQPLEGASILVVDAEGAKHELQSDAEGGFELPELVPGELRVSAQLEGYEPNEQRVTLGPDTQDLSISLDVILPPGQLRGVVRSFRGRPLEAELRIVAVGNAEAEAEAEGGPTVVQSGADGSFEIDLPPGDYEVTVTRDRFKTQTLTIQVEQDGVTIMNVDLRR